MSNSISPTLQMTVIVISYHTSGLLSVTTVSGDLYPRENPCINEPFTFLENTWFPAAGIKTKAERRKNRQEEIMESFISDVLRLTAPYTQIY